MRHPELRSLFPAAMDTQRDRLFKALLTAAEHIDDTEVLAAYLSTSAAATASTAPGPSTTRRSASACIGALAGTPRELGRGDGGRLGAGVHAISQIMIDAAAEDETARPGLVARRGRLARPADPGHRRRHGPSRPAVPLPAGQYTSLETPWWPRIWRHYSFASAPRSDGLLSFHVKAVPAGWVSNALVHRARPGDVVRLGPPAGSMTVDHTTDSGLLCLGGGTGIAPIKALVEDVAEHGERRPVEVFYGARTDHDLYDIDTMLRLQQSIPGSRCARSSISRRIMSASPGRRTRVRAVERVRRLPLGPARA